MARLRLHKSVWLLFFLIGIVWESVETASAGIQKASDKIVDSTTIRVIETIPDVGSDLPVVLPRSQDVYLLVTAGAAYTDVRVLALSPVDPSRLAHALDAAAAGTTLADTDVTWSADTYSAARLVQKRGHIGRRVAVNAVPVGALTDGLRRAGFVPHLLLRVPNYAVVPGLPSELYSTRHFRWYDDRELGKRPVITVQAGLTSPLSLWPLALFLLIPLLGMMGLAIDNRLSRNLGQPLETRRRRFHAWALQLPLVTFVVTLPVMIFVLQTSTLYILADLWLGGGNATPLFAPLAVLIGVFVTSSLVVTRRREIRLFGKPAAAVPATWLTAEEKALNQRMSRWRGSFHLLGAIAVVAALFLLPHKSSLSSAIHPLYQLVAVLGAGLVSLLFRKQVASLTRKTLDDDLTFRARRFGQLLGVRPRDVWVEDSSRASHFAVAHRDRGDHIVVSRKMRDGFTEAEMDFILAAQVARMVRVRKGTRQVWVALLALLPLGLPAAILLFHGPALSALILSPWFFPAVFAVVVLPFVLLLASSRATARDTLRQEEEADRKALEVTGDLAAAQSALSKTDAEALPPVTGSVAASSSTSSQNVSRLETRRLALKRVAEASFG